MSNISVNITAIFPEISLLILAAIILLIDVVRKKKNETQLFSWVSAIGIAVIIIFSILFLYPDDQKINAWGGMLRIDAASFTFRMLFLFGAAITALFSANIKVISERAQFFVLLLISTIGMSLMAASSDLVMLYLAIETTSIPLYILSGFVTSNNFSVESGIKYLLFGAMSSAVMLYGFSLLYGFSGSTNLYEIVAALQNGQIPLFLQMVILLLVVAGFGFKVSAVPFHFWAPDVYQGSPTPISGFLSTASKAAGFIVLMRFLLSVFSMQPEAWMLLMAILATVTMFLGNLLALVQKDMKRLLAYSSIGHAGYILIGVAAGNELGLQAAMYYLLAYLFTNLAAFGVISIVEKQVGSSEISHFSGLMKRSPGLALILLVAFLSLGGIPPFAGFVSKFLVFAAAVEAGLIWLVLIGILNSIIGLYYYLTVLRLTFSDTEEQKPIPIFLSWRLALAICVIGIVLLGVIYSPWLNLTGIASTNLLLVH